MWDYNGLVMATVQMMGKIKYKLLIKMEKELIWVKWWKQNRILSFIKQCFIINTGSLASWQRSLASWQSFFILF